MKKITTFAPLLCTVLLLGCVVLALYGYEPPVYEALNMLTEAAAADSENTSAEDADEAVSEQTLETENAGEAQELQKTAAAGRFLLADGVYKGMGMGYAGKIEVAVTIKSKSITAIDVLEVEADDAAFFNRAKGVIDKIIAQQSLDVDVVSGATYSSKGIISAVKNALTQEEDTSEAAASFAEALLGGRQTAPAVEPVTEAAAYLDGIYYGSGMGFAGVLSVKVVISGGQIVSIEITDSSDTDSYLSMAAALLDTIISTQSTNVDTVSGATYSSAGLIEAVRSALAQAAADETVFQQTQEGGQSSGGGQNDGGQQGGSGQQNSNTASLVSDAPYGNFPYPDGTYKGTGEGYMDDITVAVILQNGTIQSITVTQHGDDAAFMTRAMTVAETIVQKQSTEVDTVSGATYSSAGILQAVKNALADAANASFDSTPEPTQSASPSPTETAQPTEAPPQVSPGTTTTPGGEDTQTESPEETEGAVTETPVPEPPKPVEYTVSALCEPDGWNDFDAYYLSMRITVYEGRISAITNIKGNGDSENDSYIKRAVYGTTSTPGLVDQVIEKGIPDGIDTISRATCSSKAFLEACRQALEQAAADAAAVDAVSGAAK